MNKLLSTNAIGEPKIAISHKTDLDKEIHLVFRKRQFISFLSSQSAKGEQRNIFINSV